MTHIRSEHKDTWEMVSWTTVAQRELALHSHKSLFWGLGEKDKKGKWILNPKKKALIRIVQELPTLPSAGLQNKQMYSLRCIPLVWQHQQ